VSKVAQSFVDETGMADRVLVQAMNILEHPPEQQFDVAVMRALIQVLSTEQARQAIQNTAKAMLPGGSLFVIGHMLDDTRLSPPIAVLHNLMFLNIYDDGQAYTEREYRSWLTEAGFGDIEIQYGAAPAGASIIRARKMNEVAAVA
jgi:O-methyltransferase domain